MALSRLFCAGVPLSSYSFTAGWDRSGTEARASPIFLRFVWGVYQGLWHRSLAGGLSHIYA